VSQPGVTADATVLPGWFLWDIRDVDGDGRDEWITSPASPPGPTLTTAYLPQWQIALQHWTDASLELSVAAVIPDRIPWLEPRFRSGDKSSSFGSLYPVSVAAEDCAPMLVTRTPTGAIELVAIEPLLR
jgi:hypothetical protein